MSVLAARTSVTRIRIMIAVPRVTAVRMWISILVQPEYDKINPV
jgi:hypothetical protein